MNLIKLLSKIKKGKSSMEGILTFIDNTDSTESIGLILNAYTERLLNNNSNINSWWDSYHTTKITFYRFCSHYDTEKALRLINKIESYKPNDEEFEVS